MANPTDYGKLGIDIGGTFTDAVLEVNGQRYTDKVLTTHAAPENGVMQAVDTIIGQAEIKPGDIRLMIHGTTLATNALIERKGAKTALITTDGFRDTLEIRLEHRFEQYDLSLDLPDPLVPRNLRFTIEERINARGEVLRPIQREAVEELARQLEHHKVESLAIGLLHSYANPIHELQVEEILRTLMPNIPITLSSEVAPEMKEYERISTACANAYIQPTIGHYLVGLERDFREKGFSCPLLMMLSGGGLATVETSQRFPVRLVESGPAGGAIFSGSIATEHDLEEVVSFDMGGTTAKICLIDKGRPQTGRSFEVGRVYRFKKGSGLPLRIPVIEMVEIGAGGGSVAQVDNLKRIAVGPRSAGSTPGPACYRRGGSEPTVTDANVVLGRIDPSDFSGGRIQLDSKAAQQALEKDIGKQLNLPIELAALGVSEIVDEAMASATRVHAIESGKETSTRTLVAFGGGGPLHATRVAEKLGIDRILIPPSAGVGSAVGFLQAPIAYEITRSHYQLLSAINIKATNRVLDEMNREATLVVKAATDQQLEEKRTAYMRYFGQGHEIAIEMPIRLFTDGDTNFLQEAFEKEYQRIYGRTLLGAEIEVLTWTVRIQTIDKTVDRPRLTLESYKPKPVTRRQVFDPNRSCFIEVPIYQRSDLRPGAEIQGPAIITESETSIVVSSEYNAVIDQYNCVNCTRRKQVADSPTTIDESDRSELINLQIMWNRLTGVVEEQANTLVFGAFSTTIREGGDLSAGIFDTKGRMLAQAVTGTPGHVNTMARAVQYFFEDFPPDSMQAGDTYITNHPWKASGHLNDVTLVTPAFRKGTLIGLFAATVHLTDLGGRGMGTDARQVYEEGLYIPHMYLIRKGVINDDLLKIILANSREPLQVEGDLISTIAAGEECGRRLTGMLTEFGIETFDELANYIIENSQRATIAAIGKLQEGVYQNLMTIDGYDKPVELNATMTISKEGIHVDFTGSSMQSPYGINVVLNYTLAYTCFGIKCVVAPDIPNNHGSLEPFTVSAPEGSILNPRWPAPVSARHIIGHALPDTVMGCLYKALPEKVLAESGMMWNPYLRGEVWFEGIHRAWEMFYFQSGGMGARAAKDGLNATAFPAGIKNIPVEAAEAVAPIIFWKKDLRPDSGGAGQYRGGLGQVVEIGSVTDAEMNFQAMFDRVEHPPGGRSSGKPGKHGFASLKSGKICQSKGNQIIPKGDRLLLELPGGGGFGNPLNRDKEKVAHDVAMGLVSRATAERDYGVVIAKDGSIDEEATLKYRSQERI